MWPFCLPNPFTSETVNPLRPISPNASLTSSNLKGLIIAFMAAAVPAYQSLRLKVVDALREA